MREAGFFGSSQVGRNGRNALGAVAMDRESSRRQEKRFYGTTKMSRMVPGDVAKPPRDKTKGTEADAASRGVRRLGKAARRDIAWALRQHPGDATRSVDMMLHGITITFHGTNQVMLHGKSDRRLADAQRGEALGKRRSS